MVVRGRQERQLYGWVIASPIKYWFQRNGAVRIACIYKNINMLIIDFCIFYDCIKLLYLIFSDFSINDRDMIK